MDSSVTILEAPTIGGKRTQEEISGTGLSQQQQKGNNNRKRPRKGKQNSHNKRFSTPPPAPTCSVCTIQEETETIVESPPDAPLQSTPAANNPPKYKCPKCRALYCSVACCRKHKESCPGKPPEDTITVTTNNQVVEEDRNNHSSDHEDDDNESSSSDDDDSVEEGWQITDEMKEALQKSSWLHEELQDGGLRMVIKEVVKSSKQNKPSPQKHHYHSNKQQQRHLSSRNATDPSHDALLNKRNDNPNFNIFCDKLLVLAGVLERQQGSSNDNVDRMMGGPAVSSVTTDNNTSPDAPRDERELEQWLKQKWEPDQPPPNLALKPIRKKPIPKFAPIDVSSSSSGSEEESEEEDDENARGSSSASASSV